MNRFASSRPLVCDWSLELMAQYSSVGRTGHSVSGVPVRFNPRLASFVFNPRESSTARGELFALNPGLAGVREELVDLLLQVDDYAARNGVSKRSPLPRLDYYGVTGVLIRRFGYGEKLHEYLKGLVSLYQAKRAFGGRVVEGVVPPRLVIASRLGLFQHLDDVLSSRRFSGARRVLSTREIINSLRSKLGQNARIDSRVVVDALNALQAGGRVFKAGEEARKSGTSLWLSADCLDSSVGLERTTVFNLFAFLKRNPGATIGEANERLFGRKHRGSSTLNFKVSLLKELGALRTEPASSRKTRLFLQPRAAELFDRAVKGDVTPEFLRLLSGVRLSGPLVAQETARIHSEQCVAALGLWRNYSGLSLLGAAKKVSERLGVPALRVASWFKGARPWTRQPPKVVASWRSIVSNRVFEEIQADLKHRGKTLPGTLRR